MHIQKNIIDIVSNPFVLWATVLIPVLIYITAQLVFINADTPVFVSQNNGAFCDEGYKTLDARNMVLFGENRWSVHDEYGGWLRKSPVTVYYNYLLFKLFGVSLKVARIGNILFALGVLLLTFFVVRNISGYLEAVLVILLLVTNEVFFFFSRLALFEFKMLFFLMLGFLCYQNVYKSRWFVLPMALSWLLAFYCKGSALLFVFSIMIYWLLFSSKWHLIHKLVKTKTLIWISIITVLVSIMLQYHFIFFREFYENFYFIWVSFRSPVGMVLDLLTQPYFTKNPFLLFIVLIYCGYFVIRLREGHRVDKKMGFFIVWFFFGIISLSSFSYQPMRYYAYFCIPLAVLGTRGILDFPRAWKVIVSHGDGVLKSIIFIASFTCLLNHLLILRIFSIKDDSGWNHEVLPVILASTLVSVFVFYFIYRTMINSDHPYFTTIGTVKFKLVVLAIVVFLQLVPLSKFLSNPAYLGVFLSEKIMQIDNNAIIAGDWAPQLCIDTPHRVIYIRETKSRDVFLNVKSIAKIRPDYLIMVKEDNDGLFKEIEDRYPDMYAAIPQQQYRYAGKKILIYSRKHSGTMSSLTVDHHRCAQLTGELQWR